MCFLKFVIYCFSLILASHAAAYADTVYLNDDTEIKGIVVENYHNRIVLSTYEGEKKINKSDIRDIHYDRLEQNLVKLGDYHQDKGNASTAYSYYKKAYEANPEYKEARDKFLYMRSLLLRNPERQFRSDMARKQTLFKESGKIYDPVIKKNKSTKEDRLKQSTGLVIFLDTDVPRISTVLPFSPAAKSGLKEGDIIFSLWGRLTGYLDLDTVIGMMIYSPSPEVALSIKRKIDIVRIKNIGNDLNRIGLFVDMEENGLTVKNVINGSDAALSGLLEQDIITEINGESTRYMPLRTAVSMMEDNLASDNLQLDILRNVSLWRKEG
jgi:C-terminal processing protease CtpA/Prc